jgi:signal peptidase I
MKTVQFLLLIYLMTTGARASSIYTAPDISEAARDHARVFLQANPRCRLACVTDTGSMAPTFDSGYIVVMEPKPFEALQQGEIVAFHAEWSPTLVVHRLYWRADSGWLTKGDNLINPDPSLLIKQHYAGAVIVAAIHKRTGRVRLSL